METVEFDNSLHTAILTRKIIAMFFIYNNLKCYSEQKTKKCQVNVVFMLT